MKKPLAGRTNRRLIAASLLGMAVMVGGTLNITQAADSSTLRIKVGDKAPNFDLAAPDGKRVKVSDFAGHNVLIDFYRGYW